MIAVVLKCDRPLDVFGVACEPAGLLPLVAPLDAPIEGDGWTVSNLPAPESASPEAPAPAAPPSTDDDSFIDGSGTRRWWSIQEPIGVPQPKWVIPIPGAADETPPLRFFPKAALAVILATVPTHGPVEAVDPGHGAMPEILAAARQGILPSPMPIPLGAAKGGPLDFSDVVYRRNADWLMCACRLAMPVALDLLGNGPHTPEEARGVLAAAAEEGRCSPGAVSDPIVESVEAEQRRAEGERARAAEKARVAAELIPVSLTDAGLCAIVVEHAPDRERFDLGFDFTHGFGVLEQGTHYRSTNGVPIRPGELAYGFRMIVDGTVMLTRAQLATAKQRELPEQLLVTELRRALNDAASRPTYEESAFDSDPRTLDGRWALMLFQKHAATLVRAVWAASGVMHRARLEYAQRALLALPIAYGGRVSIPNAVHVIRQSLIALNDQVVPAFTQAMANYDTLSHRKVGKRQWGQPIALADVEKLVLQAIREPALWTWGQCLREPTKDEARAVRLELDPGLFDKIVASVIGDRREVRSVDVYAALAREGLTSSETPSAETRGFVSNLLSTWGFARKERIAEDGARQRVWQRAEAAQ